MAVVFDVKLPILGFENVIKYEFTQVDDNFVTIKSFEAEAPSFTLINPFALREYSFDVPLAVKALMDLKPDSHVLVYNIMVMKTPFNESLINFAAPLVFNVDNKTMAQVVLDDIHYPDFKAIEKLSYYLTDEQ
jgi:flagellar assembly factor FliW